ncbi:protein FAM177A1 [Hydra vulgaris]|uniref:Protein FAM177A1 n=1 Tax=Hydra vulgaris TaxID=6087 RepID=T2M9N8_HYDVU|nr:protein FAM177A1 [Hydra vulgaris]
MEEKTDAKFREIILDENLDGSMADTEDDSKNDNENRKKKLKKSRKKVYFRSDFVGEPETSSSDEEKNIEPPAKVNPADLNWLMWVWYYIVCASKSTFHAAEFCGEKLADLFGITSPKYQYAIAEYYRLKQEEEEEEDAERRETEYANRQNKSSPADTENKNEMNIV